MGSTESVPQLLVYGTIDGNDVHDDKYSFRRVPTSAASNSYRSPLKFGVSTPTRRNTTQLKGGRPSCATLSTILTSESAPFSPQCYESEDEQSPPIISHDDTPDDACWAGPVLKNIVSIISPRKKNAILSNDPFDSTSSEGGTDAYGHASVKNSTNTPESNLQLNLSDNSQRNFQDYPHQSKCALPSQQLHYSSVQPLPLSGHQREDDSEVLVSDISLQSESASPSKLDLRPPLIAEEHQDGSEDLHHFLHAASKYEAESNLDAAISSLEEFLDRSCFACDHSRAPTLHMKGILQWKSGLYFFSEHVLLDCIHMYQCLLGEDDQASREPEVYSQLLLETAHVFVSTGRVYLSKGEGDAAMRCFNECVRYLSSIPKSRCSSETIAQARIFGQACLGAGRVLASQGKLKSSLKRYKRALKNQLGPEAAVASEDISSLSVHKAKVPLNDAAETLSHLGRLYEQWNDLTRALECHAKALAIYKSQLDPCAVDIGYASNNVGQLYLRLGRVAEAEEAFKTAHKIFSLCLGRNHRNTADALLSIGQLYASQGQHSKAIATYKRVLRAESAVFGQLLAVTLHSVACSYESTLRLDKALKYYQREASVISTALSPCHLTRARLLQHMACIAMQAVDSKGEYLLLDQSLAWLEEAAEIHDGRTLNNEELLHLEASIEETRRRMKRKAQNHAQNPLAQCDTNHDH